MSLDLDDRVHSRSLFQLHNQTWSWSRASECHAFVSRPVALTPFAYLSRTTPSSSRPWYRYHPNYLNVAYTGETLVALDNVAVHNIHAKVQFLLEPPLLSIALAWFSLWQTWQGTNVLLFLSRGPPESLCAEMNKETRYC